MKRIVNSIIFLIILTITNGAGAGELKKKAAKKSAATIKTTHFTAKQKAAKLIEKILTQEGAYHQYSIDTFKFNDESCVMSMIYRYKENGVTSDESYNRFHFDVNSINKYSGEYMKYYGVGVAYSFDITFNAGLAGKISSSCYYDKVTSKTSSSDGYTNSLGLGIFLKENSAKQLATQINELRKLCGSPTLEYSIHYDAQLPAHSSQQRTGDYTNTYSSYDSTWRKHYTTADCVSGGTAYASYEEKTPNVIWYQSSGFSGAVSSEVISSGGDISEGLRRACKGY